MQVVADIHQNERAFYATDKTSNQSSNDCIKSAETKKKYYRLEKSETQIEKPAHWSSA